MTPPTLIPETYQNILNTYPAVFDVKTIPSRGYSAQGWKGEWKVGVSEDADNYVVEASVPIKNFGFERVNSGDVWRFLLCRNCLGAKPRPQASWSITQAFNEIPQHPVVHLLDDEVVAQLTGVSTIFTGQYAFQVRVVAPRARAAEADVELRFHQDAKPGGADRIERQPVKLGRGESQTVTFSGDPTGWTLAGKDGVKRGYFTVTVTEAGGQPIFRQSFPYAVTGWKPQAPVKPANAPPPEELTLSAQYGPETSTVLVKADILDFPGRERVAAAEAKVVDAATGQILASAPMRPFREWHGGAELRLSGVQIPTEDFRKAAKLRAEERLVRERNAQHQKNGEPLEQVPEAPKTAGQRVHVALSLKDREGKELTSATKELELVRYAAEWMNNDIGITDKVIPPWIPVEVKGK